MDAAKELLGNSINRIENILHALTLGTINAEIAKSLLPEIVKDLKAGFVGVTGENPWG